MKFLKSLLLSTLIIGAVWVVLLLIVALFVYINTFALLVVLNAICILIGAIIIYQGGV